MLGGWRRGVGIWKGGGVVFGLGLGEGVGIKGAFDFLCSFPRFSVDLGYACLFTICSGYKLINAAE